MKKVQFGGGYISPAVKAYAEKKYIQMGSGGAVSPSVKAHLQKKTVLMGGGGVVTPIEPFTLRRKKWRQAGVARRLLSRPICRKRPR